MDSSARKCLQIPFSRVKPGERFQMVNNVMKAAIPGSEIFKKIDEHSATNGTGADYKIRPDWMCEVVDPS